jgi:hypothetical protein
VRRQISLPRAHLRKKQRKQTKQTTSEEQDEV